MVATNWRNYCRGGKSTLETLLLSSNNIDDEGVEILADALQNNTSLVSLGLDSNRISSERGIIMLLKLVNDISSIEATLQSNHTLRWVGLQDNSYQDPDASLSILRLINMAVGLNTTYRNKASKEKVIQIQLDNEVRERMANLQGVHHSVFSDIDPIYLPEILSLIGERHGRNKLYTALSSSIVTLFSTINRKKCVQQQMDSHAAIIAEHAAIIAEHTAKLDELGAELGAIEAAEGCAGNDEIEHRSNKRRRKWWWGLWG